MAGKPNIITCNYNENNVKILNDDKRSNFRRNLTEPNYLQLSCPQDRVFAALSSVLRRLLPFRTVWGSRHNQNVFLSNVHSFIRMGRGSDVSVSTLVNKIRLKDIPWLDLHHPDIPLSSEDTIVNNIPTDDRVDNDGVSDDVLYPVITINESLKKYIRTTPANTQLTSQQRSSLFSYTKDYDILRQHLIGHFMYWLFADVILRLLGRVFYVTEGEGTAGETLYYLRSEWEVVMEAGLSRLKNNFMKVCLSDRN